MEALTSIMNAEKGVTSSYSQNRQP